MSKKAYLITRSVVALAAVAVFFWLFLVPPKLNTGMGNEYSSCHAVGWNFSGVQDPLVNDSFDVESPSKVQRYLDGAIAYKMEATEKVRSDIQRLCHEARLERSVLLVDRLRRRLSVGSQTQAFKGQKTFRRGRISRGQRIFEWKRTCGRACSFR